MFWTLLFPILLATMFHFAFANLNSAYTFQKFNIAVVNNAQFKSGTAFRTTVDALSGGKKGALFNVTYCGRARADSLLNNSRIEGYIYYDGAIRLAVKESGFDQSILRSFLDEYQQKMDAAKTIIQKNPMAGLTIASDLTSDQNWIKQVSQTGSKSGGNELVCYFYALIAMACMYGGFFGMKEVFAVQANQSAQGARVNMAPVHKLKVFLASICAATAVQLICVYILFAYLVFVLNVDFGTKVPFILLAGVVSCFTGVSYGAFIGAVVKAGEGLKVAIVVASTMVLSFLSGLMNVDIKYLIQQNAPAVAFLNPANAIADSFYALYYYSTYTRYFTNIALLLGFSLIFYLGVYFVMRRQKYVSI
jgi:ABC-type multidrug transport system, permease component